MLDILIILLVIALGFSFKNWIRYDFSLKEKKVLNQLWIYHLFFGFVFWAYIMYGPGGDAYGYWYAASTKPLSNIIVQFAFFGPGTHGMYLLSYFPSNFLGLSFLTVSLLFSLLGYLGLVYFFTITVKHVKHNSTISSFKLFPLLFFLPNVHFWSSGLGKDTVSLFCIAMFIYGMQKPKAHVFKIILALGLSYLIRPHITIFLIVSFVIAFMLSGKLKIYHKLFVVGLFIVAFIVLFDRFMNFINVDSLDVETIQEFSNTKAANLSRSGTSSGVDISSYPYPLKVFTFLYRPLFFDINGVLAIVASFENLFLLLLSIKFIKCNPLKMWRQSNHLFKGMLVFFLIGILTFPLILGNLGIMLRQKNMFMPALFFICLWSFSNVKQQKS